MSDTENTNPTTQPKRRGRPRKIPQATKTTDSSPSTPDSVKTDPEANQAPSVVISKPRFVISKGVVVSHKPRKPVALTTNIRG